jgi:hypothetical protein
MAKYLKITPPNGFPVVVPDSESTRRHFEKLNESIGKGGTQYKIAEASEADIEAFNPQPERKVAATAPATDTAQINALKAKIETLTANQTEIDALKAKVEALTAAIAANPSPATTAPATTAPAKKDK